MNKTRSPEIYFFTETNTLGPPTMGPAIRLNEFGVQWMPHLAEGIPLLSCNPS